jgi:hypothetical protein
MPILYQKTYRTVGREREFTTDYKQVMAGISKCGFNQVVVEKLDQD